MTVRHSLRSRGAFIAASPIEKLKMTIKTPPLAIDSVCFHRTFANPKKATIFFLAAIQYG
jgi:hypothetical protein